MISFQNALDDLARRNREPVKAKPAISKAAVEYGSKVTPGRQTAETVTRAIDALHQNWSPSLAKKLREHIKALEAEILDKDQKIKDLSDELHGAYYERWDS